MSFLFIFILIVNLYHFQNALNTSMDDSKKRSATTTIPTSQKAASGTTSVRVSICDRGSTVPTPTPIATTAATTSATTTPDVEAKTPTNSHALLHQVQCKLSNNGATTPTSVQTSNAELRASRETVLPPPVQLSRRSSRENNGITGSGADDPPSRNSMTSVSGRGVRPDWAHPSVSVVESVIPQLNVLDQPDVNVAQLAKDVINFSSAAASSASTTSSLVNNYKQPSLEKRSSEERNTMITAKPYNNNGSISNVRAEIQQQQQQHSTTPKTSYTKASSQNSSSSSSPTPTARRASASSTSNSTTHSPITHDTTTTLGHPEPCV